MKLVRATCDPRNCFCFHKLEYTFHKNAKYLKKIFKDFLKSSSFAAVWLNVVHFYLLSRKPFNHFFNVKWIGPEKPFIANLNMHANTMLNETAGSSFLITQNFPSSVQTWINVIYENACCI